jgi:multidrug efflux pump subunit AcrA (membrane-fusion protein)
VALVLGCDPTGVGPRWASVERGDLAVHVDISGQMRAVDSDSVGPPGIRGVWDYKIAMMGEEGSVVEEGQPVLMFDTTDLQRRLEQKTSERDSAATQLQLEIAAAKVAREDEALAMAEAEAALRKAKIEADAPEDLTAIIELEKARLDLDLARAKVVYLRAKAKSARQASDSEIERYRRKRDRAEERVKEIQSAMEAMGVKAPRTGTIIYETNWEGEKKKVGDNAWRAETVLRVVSLDEMEADGEVDEVDISRVDVGQVVSLRLDAQADTEIEGVVREISDTVGRASRDNPIKVAHLKIDIADGQETGHLRPGMRFRGKIETGRIGDALVVPLHAVFPTADGPVAHRETVGGIETVPVVLGDRNAFHIVVLEGLEESDRVLEWEDEQP